MLEACELEFIAQIFSLKEFQLLTRRSNFCHFIDSTLKNYVYLKL